MGGFSCLLTDHREGFITKTVMWTRDLLCETIKARMSDYLLVVVSNRQPYSHQFRGGKVTCLRQPGGVVTALNPVLQAARGLWVALGTSSYDRQAVNALEQPRQNVLRS